MLFGNLDRSCAYSSLVHRDTYIDIAKSEMELSIQLCSASYSVTSDHGLVAHPMQLWMNSREDPSGQSHAALLRTLKAKSGGRRSLRRVICQEGVHGIHIMPVRSPLVRTRSWASSGFVWHVCGVLDEKENKLELRCLAKVLKYARGRCDDKS